MPPLPRLRVSVLADLAAQLKFVPQATARRHVERCEAMAEQIDPATTYPEDWIVLRITGYRPDKADPALVVGEALLGDLGALAERLSKIAQWTLDELPPPEWLTIADLCERWNISRGTLERYRRRGLLGRRCRAPAGTQGRRGMDRLVFRASHAERFMARHAAALGGAAAFSRMDEPTRAQVLVEAARMRTEHHWKPARIARELAPRFGRAIETLRRVLVEEEQGREARRGPLTARDHRLIARAMRAGISAGVLAERFGKSPAAIHRARLAYEAEWLRSLDLSGPGDAVFVDDARPQRFLDEAVVHVGLGEPGEPNLPAHTAATLAAGWPDAAIELARARAMCLLRWRAARGVGSLDRHFPSAEAMDEIVTDLRWAARLKAELVRGEQMLLLKTVEGLIGRGIQTLPAGAGVAVFWAAQAALVDAAERYDPFRGGRLAAPAGLAMSRAVSRWLALQGGGVPVVTPPARLRAVPLHDPVAARLEDWTRSVCRWQEWLEPDVRVFAAMPRIGEVERALIAARQGWGRYGGMAPITLGELARRLVVPITVAARRERSAMLTAVRMG